MNRLHRWDAALSAALAAPIPSPRWKWAGRIAHLGDGPLVLGLLLGLYGLGWLLEAASLRRSVLITLVGVAATAVMVTIIKYIWRRQRPRDPTGFVSFSYDKYSFPSGHSARMAALAVGAASLHPLAGAGFGLLALAVAWARVVIGIHFVGDVLVGLVVGAAVTGAVWWGMG